MHRLATIYNVTDDDRL